MTGTDEDILTAGAGARVYVGVRPADLRFEGAHQLAEYIDQAQHLVDTVISQTAQARERSEDLALAGQRALSMAGRVASEIRTLAEAIPDLPTAAADAKVLHDLIEQLASERTELEVTRASVQATLETYERDRKAVMDEAKASLQERLRKQGIFWRLAWAFGAKA